MGMLNWCMAVPKSYFQHVIEWHCHAKIEHSRARHKVQYRCISCIAMPFSCAPMPDLCGSQRDDSFQQKFKQKGTYLLVSNQIEFESGQITFYTWLEVILGLKLEEQGFLTSFEMGFSYITLLFNSYYVPNGFHFLFIFFSL